MAAYTEMVNAQLRLLNKQFIVILNGHFNTIYLSMDYEQYIFKQYFFLIVNKQKKGYILI